MSSTINRTCRGIILVALSALAAGCDIDGMFNPEGQRVVGGAISSPKEWTLSCQPHGQIRGLKKAHDGNITTVAISGRHYQNASVTIDLGRSCYFNSISILHGDKQYGFARRVEVSTSHDGRNFTPRQVFPGTRKVTYLLMMTPVRARYIRLRATVQGRRPWAIAEIYLQ